SCADPRPPAHGRGVRETTGDETEKASAPVSTHENDAEQSDVDVSGVQTDDAPTGSVADAQVDPPVAGEEESAAGDAADVAAPEDGATVGGDAASDAAAADTAAADTADPAGEQTDAEPAVDAEEA